MMKDECESTRHERASIATECTECVSLHGPGKAKRSEGVKP
jgi:hypothetical protein